MLFQELLHRGISNRFVFGLVEFYQGFEILGFLLVEFQNFDKFGDHAGGDLFTSDHIGEVATALFETEQIADFGTGKTGFLFGAGNLVFFQKFAEVRKLVYV